MQSCKRKRNCNHRNHYMNVEEVTCNTTFFSKKARVIKRQKINVVRSSVLCISFFFLLHLLHLLLCIQIMYTPRQILLLLILILINSIVSRDRYTLFFLNQKQCLMVVCQRSLTINQWPTLCGEQKIVTSTQYHTTKL